MLPLGGQHGGAEHHQPTSLVSDLQFFPDIQSFDGLSQSYFICDEQAVGHRFDELHHRLELVGIEVSIAEVHRVEDVGQSSGHLFLNDEFIEISCIAIEA